MMHLVCGHTGSGNTSYLVKLACDESAQGNRVLFISPEYNIEAITNRMYAYSMYLDIAPNIEIHKVPFSKQSIIMIHDYIRGKERYDTIIIDCARALMNDIYDDVFHEISHRCGKVILGIQLNRHGNTRDIHNIENSILSNISAGADIYTVIERISEPLNNGLNINIINTSTSGRDCYFTDVESFMISTISLTINNIKMKIPILKLI